MSLAKIDQMMDANALSEDITPFGLFELELPDGTPLWELKLAPKEVEKDDSKEERAARIALYAERVAAGLTPWGEKIPEGDEAREEKQEEEEEDEWTHFWGGAAPTERLAIDD